MKLHSRAARNKSKSQTPRTSRWTEGRSEAATTTDAGTAPGGGCTGSTDGGAAPAEDAADAPAGTEGTAEVRLPLLTRTLGTPGTPQAWHRQAVGAH